MLVTATDMFSGGGGASEGMRQAGIRVQACANHSPVAVSTHRHNHPDAEHHLANLSDVDFRRFPSTTLLWASPSCVWHTPAGGRKALPIEQERLRLDAGAVDRATAFAVIAAAEVHRYPVVIVENVREWTNWTLYPWWLDGMAALGYQAQTIELDAADFGVPQRRVRWFGVFTLGVTVDLTLPAPQRVPASTILEPHLGKPVTRTLYVSPQIEQIRAKNVPHLVTYRRNAKPLRTDEHPLPTVTAGGNHHAVATLTSAGPHHRMLTNRECARAQGFPDWYTFDGSAAEVKRMIGNAVAVPVAKWLGQCVSAGLAGQGPGVRGARAVQSRS